MQITPIPGAVTVLAVAGDIDASTFTQLIEEADRQIGAGNARLVIDLSEVNYISSAGLVALQTITGRAAAAGGRMVLCGLNAQVMKVFEIAGFERMLAIAPDRASAIASFQP